ncbi:cobalt-precorrin-6A reductase, partial [Prosthecomicrobium hirschii]
MRVLILGGTTEASRLARLMAGRPDLAPVLSLAGRTEAPAAQPIPTRIGGFGGVAGLVAYLRAEAIEAVVDATHPFAAVMSRHAAEACRIA